MSIKKRVLIGLGGVSMLLVGCSSPTVEGYVWDVDLSQGDIVGSEEEEIFEYIQPQLEFEDDTVTMDFEYGDLTEASGDVQFGMMFVTGMLETLDISTTYTEEDNILTFDPSVEMDVGGSYSMDWEGKDKVKLTPLEEGDEGVLVLDKKAEIEK